MSEDVRKALVFKKSSLSNSQGDQCVEIATHKGSFYVRDSKNPNGPVLEFTSGEWDAFIGGVKADEFDV